MPSSCEVKFERGRTAFNKANYPVAAENFENALASFRNLAKKTETRAALQRVYDTCLWLGVTFSRQSRFEEAEPILREAYEGYEKIAGENAANTLKCQHWFGLTLVRLGKLEEAKSLLEDAVCKWRRLFKGGTPAKNIQRLAFDSTQWLARIAYLQGRPQKALELFRTAHKNREAVFEADDVDVLDSKHWIGQTLCTLQDYDGAETCLRAVVDRRTSRFGSTVIGTLSSMHWLGVALYHRKSFVEAESFLSAALEGRKSVLPPGHPDIIATQSALCELNESRQPQRLAPKESLLKDIASLDCPQATDSCIDGALQSALEAPTDEVSILDQPKKNPGSIASPSSSSMLKKSDGKAKSVLPSVEDIPVESIPPMPASSASSRARPASLDPPKAVRPSSSRARSPPLSDSQAHSPSGSTAGPDHAFEPEEFGGGQSQQVEFDDLTEASQPATGCFFDAVEASSTQDFHKSDTWFRKLREKVHNPLAELQKGRFKRVKVAILDTGVYSDHGDFQNNLSGPQKGRVIAKDFLTAAATAAGPEHRTETAPSIKEGVDEYGHGTHCAGVLRRVAPAADLYIAKIAHDKTSINHEAVARAIDHAIDKKGWDVDIISISFGFQHNSKIDESVGKAIRKAVYRKKLIFAAAANSGNAEYMSYPAWESGVFAINSADADGTPSTFNPRDTEGRSLFSALGEAVESAWIPARQPTTSETSPLRRMTGTSVATPIAAGIAALLLQTASLPSDNPETQSKLGRLLRMLRWHPMMRDALRALAEPKGGYVNLLPCDLARPSLEVSLLTAFFDRVVAQKTNMHVPGGL